MSWLRDKAAWLRKQEQQQVDGTWEEVSPEAADQAQSPLNRRQRRLYLRHVQVSAHPTAAQVRERRHVRLHVVGFGAWRRFPGRAQAAVARKLDGQ